MINCELSHYFASVSSSQTKPNIFSIDMMMMNNHQQFKKKKRRYFPQEKYYKITEIKKHKDNFK